jgi:hypothetical protein
LGFHLFGFGRSAELHHPSLCHDGVQEQIIGSF